MLISIGVGWPGLRLLRWGVVYGDIGTSPLYAFKQCFNGSTEIAVTTDNVLGVLSLIIWALILVVSVKYLWFVMKADNRGEGGIIALVALLNPWNAAPGSRRDILMILGLFGAALLFGPVMLIWFFSCWSQPWFSRSWPFDEAGWRSCVRSSCATATAFCRQQELGSPRAIFLPVASSNLGNDPHI